MNFVYPAFLFGFFALAIPVIIHLFNFRRFRTIYFTNVRFLRDIQEETATKSKLKHLLVLIARLLALSFLILAFAQPFLPSKNAHLKSTQRAVGIYIDNSFSMESANNDEPLIDMAKRKAEEIVNGYTVDDKFQLLTNDLEAKHQRLLSKDEMLEMVREVQVSPTVRPLNEIFDRQKDLLNRAGDGVQKIVYEISDFQKNAGTITNDTTTLINLLRLEGSEQRNVAIDSLWFVTPVQMLDQPLELCIRIKNYGTDEIKNVPVTLKLNDQIKSLTDVSVPAGSEVTDTLAFTLNTAGWCNGEVTIKDYPVSFDDAMYFSFSPLSNIPVLCINADQPNAFLESLYGGSKLFAVKNDPVSNIGFNALETYDLIILNDVRSISGGLSQALLEQLNRGCNVAVFPAMDADVNSLNAFLSKAGVGEYGSIIKSKRNVTELNIKLPLLSDVYEKIPHNLSLPYADQSFEINADAHTLEERILTFADAKPLMAKYPSGNGTIYLSAVPLNRNFTDFPVQGGLFVPLMYKIAISTTGNTVLYATIGHEKWIPLQQVHMESDQTLKVKSAGNEFIPEIRNTGITTEINLSAYTQLAGMYMITGTAESGKPTDQTIALNYDRRESDMHFYAEKELEDLYGAANQTVIKNPERSLSGEVERLNEGTPLWKFCVIFVLIFLAAEIALIRLLP